MIERSVEIELIGSDGVPIAMDSKPRVFEWFIVPEGEVTVEHRSPGRVRLRLTSEKGIGRRGSYGEELPDLPIGSLPIATLNPNTGLLETVFIKIPPPSPLGDADIDEMWSALKALPAPARRWVRRRALWTESAPQRRPSDFDLFVASLPDLVEFGHHLLSRWPQRESVDTYWRSIELAGGREDSRATLRSAGRLPTRRGALGQIPVKTIRTRADTVPWQLTSVAILAGEVARRVRLEAGAGHEHLVRPLEGVAERSRSSRRVLDPPASSWPASLRMFHNAALDVLAAMTADGHGADRAPLCHLWLLYEAWVSTRVLEHVTSLKGRQPDEQPTLIRTHRGGAAWRASWLGSNEVVEVWGQLDIGARPQTLCDDPNFTIRSLTSVLIPDVLVASRSSEGYRVSVVDAKFRTGAMEAEDAATSASKYHWGLRPELSGNPLGISHVLLATTGEPCKLFDPVMSRITVSTLLPSAGAPAGVIGAATVL